jgi:MFS family permease
MEHGKMSGMKSTIATRAVAVSCHRRTSAGLTLRGRAVQHGLCRFFTFLIPLYGQSPGLDASEIGVLVGARSILAMFLSIHIGVLMDRFGTRAVALVFLWTGMVLAPLFPLATGFWTLLLLQLANGAAVSFAWAGVQTLIAQLAEGDARYIGRFSFFARFGSTSAPIVAGVVWDLGGAWPAYLLGAAWGAILTATLIRTPDAEFFTRQSASGTNRNRFRARDAWPRRRTTATQSNSSRSPR